MGNPYAPKKKAPEVVEEPKSEIPEDVTTIKEIIEWVGDSTDKAKLALEEESSKENPRKTLVKDLEEIING